MTSRRIPTRAKTAPIKTLHSLLTVQEAEIAITRRPFNSVLINYDELPAWRRNNQFILAHYRPTSHSFFTSFQSLFQLHNESVNIHTHLFGAWVFFFIALSLYAFERHLLTWTDSVAFLIFFSSAVVCLGMSAMYHTVSNHSPKVRRVPIKVCFIQLKSFRSINGGTKWITWASSFSFLEASSPAFTMASIASQCYKDLIGGWYVRIEPRHRKEPPLNNEM